MIRKIILSLSKKKFVIDRKVKSSNKIFEYVKRSKRSDFIPNRTPCML